MLLLLLLERIFLGLACSCDSDIDDEDDEATGEPHSEQGLKDSVGSAESQSIAAAVINVTRARRRLGIIGCSRLGISSIAAEHKQVL